MNDLNQLNEMLFETFRDIKGGKIEEKKGAVLVQISNSIINNAKLQLSAYKLAKSESTPQIFSLPEKPSHQIEKETKEKRRRQAKKDRHQAMTDFAIEKGYNNAALGISEMTKPVFMTQFENWMTAEN